MITQDYRRWMMKVIGLLAPKLAMQNIYFAVFLLVLSPAASYAQNAEGLRPGQAHLAASDSSSGAEADPESEDPKKEDPMAGDPNAEDAEAMGSANQLEGKVYNVAIFISTPENPWTQAQKQKVLDEQRVAENWLAAQAKEYEVDLSFENGRYGFEKDVSVPHIPGSTHQNLGYKQWISYVLGKIGWKSPTKLWTWAQEHTHCANMQVMIYANTRGVSYGMPFREGLNKSKYFVEGSIIYGYYNSGASLLPATIAHEMLHLYGAWDLYKNSMQTADREAKARKLFSNDIMLRVGKDFDELMVGPLTAWRVGWNDKTETWYKWFEPKGRSVAEE